MLWISYQSERIYTRLKYYCHTISINIFPVGIHVVQLQSVFDLSLVEKWESGRFSDGGGKNNFILTVRE